MTIMWWTPAPTFTNLNYIRSITILPRLTKWPRPRLNWFETHSFGSTDERVTDMPQQLEKSCLQFVSVAYRMEAETRGPKMTVALFVPGRSKEWPRTRVPSAWVSVASVTQAWSATAIRTEKRELEDGKKEDRQTKLHVLCADDPHTWRLTNGFFFFWIHEWYDFAFPASPLWTVNEPLSSTYALRSSLKRLMQ